MGRQIRVITAVMGLDGHDRGVKVVSRALKESGMEVIYLGIRQTAVMVAEAALQEDVDVIGVSVHSGNFEVLSRLVTELRYREVSLDEILLVVGGIIPSQESQRLLEVGYNFVFGPGSPTTEMVEIIKNWVENHSRS